MKVNFLVLLLMGLLSFGCKTSSDASSTKEITSDVPHTPLRKVIRHLTLVKATEKALTDHGYRGGCIELVTTTDEVGAYASFIDVFALPTCSASTDAPALEGEALAKLSGHLQIEDFAYSEPILYILPKGYKIDFLNGTPQQVFANACAWSETTADGKPYKSGGAYSLEDISDIGFYLNKIDVHINSSGYIDHLALKAASPASTPKR